MDKETNSSESIIASGCLAPIIFQSFNVALRAKWENSKPYNCHCICSYSPRLYEPCHGYGFCFAICPRSPRFLSSRSFKPLKRSYIVAVSHGSLNHPCVLFSGAALTSYACSFESLPTVIVLFSLALTASMLGPLLTTGRSWR